MKKTIYSGEAEIFRAMLREAREKAGLSQSALATKLGTYQPFVARVETGERRLDFMECLHFLRTLGISPVSFMRRFETRVKANGGAGRP